MTDSTRVEQRRVDRRPATVPHELPTEDEDNDLDMAPPGMRSNTMSLVQNSLCKRCRFLRKDLQEPGFDTCLVKLSSLDLDCQYCQQFNNVFEVAKSSEKNLTDMSQLSLYRDLFKLENERVSNPFAYLKIRFGTAATAPDIHFFPLEVKRGSEIFPVGRYIKPCSADFEMFRTVLHDCRERHKSTCTPSPAEPSLLRLIDCRDRRIIQASQHQRYICLSYVWGNHVDETLTRDGALPDNIPKTVEDAMFVAIQLGVPFLWVDRYCIDQGKPQEKHNIIRNMDKIYHGAELTIIATVGEGPQHGLPGVRGTSRKLQCQLNLGEDIYVAAEQIRDEIDGSKWASRGWTYQEMLLSCRRLVFTKTQMYFQCMSGISIESVSPCFGSHSASSLATGLSLQFIGNWSCSIPFEEVYGVFPVESTRNQPDYLNERLKEYYKRQLSFGTDAIEAFLGIINFYRTSRPTGSFYGVLYFYDLASEPHLPLASFLEGLLWSTTPSNVKPHTFPSWSWASVKASQPADVSCDLATGFTPEQYDFEIYQDIDIHVQHRLGGIIQLADLAWHEDDYKCFMPWIDITTWTRPCKVERSRSGLGLVSLYPETYETYNPLALDRGVVHAICLKARGTIIDRFEIHVVGLLVVETEPGLYRRVGELSWSVDLNLCELAKKYRAELQKAKGPPNTGIKAVAVQMRRLREGGWHGPHLLERLSDNPWQRRTMRLI